MTEFAFESSDSLIFFSITDDFSFCNVKLSLSNNHKIDYLDDESSLYVYIHVRTQQIYEVEIKAKLEDQHARLRVVIHVFISFSLPNKPLKWLLGQRYSFMRDNFMR